MVRFLAALSLSILLAPAGISHAKTYDAVTEYVCEAAVSGAWAYEGYRASDGKYLAMEAGRAPITEVDKYGVDAFYIPDSGQPYYPFITRFPDGLWASPATDGPRFDAVLTWISKDRQKARISGYVILKGNLAGNAEGKKIKAMIKRGDDVLWSSDISGGQTATFDLKTDASAGDRYHLHIINDGDKSGDMALFNMRVETSAK